MFDIPLSDMHSIERERKIAVEKQQAYYQAQVSTSKRRQDRPLIAAYFCLSLLTSVNFADSTPVCLVTQNRCLIRPAVPVIT